MTDYQVTLQDGKIVVVKASSLEDAILKANQEQKQEEKKEIKKETVTNNN